MRRSRTVAVSTIPVSPMPPAVAQKAPAVSGESGRSDAGLTGRQQQRQLESTCWQNEPSRWWFLPWMSLPIAPPTVT